DRDRYRTIADLRGHRVATLIGTMAYDFLKTQPLTVITYDDDVHPYSDLHQHRVDAVLLDNIIAARRLRAIPGLFMEPQPVTAGRYVVVLARRNTAVRDRIDAVLKARMRDGTLEQIYKKWGIWDSYQPAFFQRVFGGQKPATDNRQPTTGNVVA